MGTKINPTLYEIASDVGAIVDRLIESDGVLDDETEAAFDTLTGALDAKIERCALAVRALDAAATAAKVEADRLAKLATARTNAAKRLKEYMQSCMAIADTRKVETDLVRVSIVKNSRPSIRWTGEDEAIPDSLARVRREFDGQAAYAAWKAGEVLPANAYVEQGEHLRVA